MIGRLRGHVAECRPELVLLDVGGVGYELEVPLSTYYELEKVDGDKDVTLHVRTYLRDDRMTLFGFWSRREKDLFERLIGVSKIGPKVALGILSGLAPDDLIAALAAGDVARLSRVPRVGQKTAERLVLELKDKVTDLAAGAVPETRAAADDDLLLALLGLGYKRREAERAAQDVADKASDKPFHEQLRMALGRLSRA